MKNFIERFIAKERVELQSKHFIELRSRISVRLWWSMTQQKLCKIIVHLWKQIIHERDGKSIHILEQEN